MNKPTGVKGRVSSLTASLMGGEDTEGLPRQPRGSGAKSGPAQMMDFSATFQDVTQEKERLKEQLGQPIAVKLHLLIPSPYQAGSLEESRIVTLVANLRNNPLNTPVVVRQAGEALEIISGHHRVEAFRRLDREEIPAIFSKVDDDVARALVFFDNLVSPNLSDLAKFEGFQMLRGDSDMTYEEMARRAGVTGDLVKGVMHFGRLPEGALDIIRKTPHAVGYNAARHMSPFTDKNPQKVLACLTALVEGKITASGVKRFLEAGEGTARDETGKHQAPLTIRQGKKKYADVLVRNGELKIKFKDAAQAAAMQPAIVELLQETAAKA